MKEITQNWEVAPIYEKEIPSTRKARDEVLDLLLKKIHQLAGKVALDKFELRLVLDEALTNALEHGNMWDERKFVRIRLYPPMDGFVQVSIKDEGFGFNHEILREQGSLEPNNRPSYRGRGIFIIRQFCKVCWNSIGNEIILSIPLARKEG